MATLSSSQSAVILTKPRITEKATLVTGNINPVYTFEVPAGANKIQIKKAIMEKYKVSPVKVNITNLPRKKVIVRGKRGVKPGVKKALVYMPKGTNIDFV